MSVPLNAPRSATATAVKALGADTGISKSEVSRIGADLDQEVGAFRDRSLAEQQFPYIYSTRPTAKPE
jgi:transposase-like protein